MFEDWKYGCCIVDVVVGSIQGFQLQVICLDGIELIISVIGDLSYVVDVLVCCIFYQNCQKVIFVGLVFGLSVQYMFKVFNEVGIMVYYVQYIGNVCCWYLLEEGVVD